MEFINNAATELELVQDTPLSLDARITSLGIDSVSLVEIVGMVEEEFQVRLSQAEFQAAKTLGDLAVLVERQVGPDLHRQPELIN
jgi:acyl carrier protein